MRGSEWERLWLIAPNFYSFCLTHSWISWKKSNIILRWTWIWISCWMLISSTFWKHRTINILRQRTKQTFLRRTCTTTVKASICSSSEEFQYKFWKTFGLNVGMKKNILMTFAVLVFIQKSKRMNFQIECTPTSLKLRIHVITTEIKAVVTEPVFLNWIFRIIRCLLQGLNWKCSSWIVL